MSDWKTSVIGDYTAFLMTGFCHLVMQKLHTFALFLAEMTD